MNESQSTPEETFKRVTFGRGQVFQRELMPEAVLEAYDQIRERAQDLIDSARQALPHLPPIHFDFVINGEVNATAFFADERYFIALNTGTAFILGLITNRMLSDPTVFTWVGDPSREEAGLPPIEDYNLDRPHADSLYTTNPSFLPKDEVRRAYAYFLRDQALMFIIGHEIAHITRGHVAYVLKERLTPEYRENLWLPEDDLELRLERQALEQDADGRSVGARISSLRDGIGVAGYKRLPWVRPNDEIAGLFRDWSISANIAFRLFADPSFSSSASKPTLRAPPVFRWLIAKMAAAYSVREYWDPRLEEPLLQVMAQGSTAVKDAFEAIFKDRATLVQLEESAVHDGLEHVRKLHDYWYGNLRDKVRPYAFEPI